MILYLMRHAEATEKLKSLPDEWRYLTKNGRSTSSKICRKIKKNFLSPNLIMTSPLIRAVQTAEIFANLESNKNEIIVSELLKPDANIDRIIMHLQNYKKMKSLMLVGHEPLLGMLIANLLERNDIDFSLKKSSCVAIDIRIENHIKAEFLWYLKPGKKTQYSLKKAFLHG